MSTQKGHYEEKVRPCIDLIDSLRSLGVEQDLALPAIAVIGDQSSGKSSVLEALSGVELPRSRKYPLILKMKRTKVGDDLLYTNNGDDWCGVVKYQKLEKIINQAMLQNPEDVKRAFQQVTPWDFSLTSQGFLILEITSPNVPNLTLIDLPSIPIGQSNQTYDQVKSFIKKQKTFTLVVTPCDVDLAKTQALKMAMDVDPDGLRTLGILTKPDLVHNDREKIIVDIVQNKVIPLKKGYMIVKCRDQETNASMTDAIKREKAFFKDHVLFKTLYDDGYATVPKLAERLTLELQRHIEKYLPTLKKQINNVLFQDNAELKRYGHLPPSDGAGRFTFLSDKVTAFTVDTISFLTGGLLELIDKKIFGEWRDIVQNSRDTFNLNLEEEVNQHEKKHPESMLSGFINYNTFKCMVKDHIKLLEEPAVLTLRNVTEMVKKELEKHVENSFVGFPKLTSKAKSMISEVSLAREKAAESTVRMQFKMELFVHTGDNMCSKNLGKLKKEDTHVFSSTNSGNNGSILNNMMIQLKSYYHIACQRLAGQIPLVIRFQMLQELAVQLQKDMLQILQNPDTSILLKEDSSINTKRTNIQSRFKRLTTARVLLSEL